MNALSSLTNFNPLSLLGGAEGALPGLDGADPISALLALVSNQGAGAAGGQEAGQVCSCGGGCAEGGACNCGCSCCQKNQDLGF
jgi:hypothetical protein